MLRTKTGGKYKLFWKGCTEGVSTRVSERLMMVKLVVGKVPYECCGSLCTTDREESRREG